MRGDIALDDIQLMNCNFPAVQQSCLSNQFRCTRGACVSKNTLCDFTDDCGDNSDEANCGRLSPLGTDYFPFYAVILSGFYK